MTVFKRTILNGALCASLVLLFLLAACAAPAPTGITSTATATATPVIVPVEVTRVVPRDVVLVATPTPPFACGSPTLAEASEVVIGGLLPLSQNGGWQRALAMQAGMNVAMDEIMAQGGLEGKSIRLVAYDTAGQAERAAVLAEQLITRDCAVGIVAGVGDTSAAAVSAMTERYGTPLLLIDASTDALTASYPHTVFRLLPAASMVARMPAEWLSAVGDYNGDGDITAVVIADNTPSGNLTIEQAEQWFPALGMRLETLRVDLPANDFSPQIARIVAMKMVPDAIFISISTEGALDLQRQIMDAGIKAEKGTLLVTGRAALDGNQFWQRVPEGQWTVVARRGPWASSLNDVGRSFLERYRQFSVAWPDNATFGAYDGIRLLEDAISRAASLRGDDMVRALEETDIDLAAGHYRFPYGSTNPPAGHNAPDYLWHQWGDPPLLFLQFLTANQDPATAAIVWPELYSTTDGPVSRP